MYVVPKKIKIVKGTFDDILNIGTTCTAGLSIKELGLSKEVIPIFNDVVSTPKTLYDIFMTDFKHYKELCNCDSEKCISPTRDEIIVSYLFLHNGYKRPNLHHNVYGISFIYQDALSEDYLKEYLNLQIGIFKKKLKKSKKLLFIYTHEDSINFPGSYKNREENYFYIVKICEFLKKNYPSLDFLILAYHTNISFEDTEHVVNFEVKIDEEYFTDYLYKPYFDMYRDVITKSLDSILNL
jgi:hypothetical protein